jgi:branched-chain amino acid transport system ATP-binding protein/urea transport system ATP-binding protein
LSVYENLWLAARSSRGRRAADERARELAARLGLAGLLQTPAGTLAHGQRQWVEIAMVVAREPKLVLLDEPSAGMTIEETSQTAALIREVNQSASVIVVEHDMQFIRQIAHKVTVFHQGRILVEDTFERVVADPLVRDVYLGRQRVA